MKMRTLLAVTLATASPAAAAPERSRSAPVIAPPPGRAATGSLACLRTAKATAPSAHAAVAAPRTLPTGSPACGNVQSKGGSSRRETIEACLRAEAAKAEGKK